MSERRRTIRVEPRGMVPKVGKIVFPDDPRAIDCRVIDLSAGGACLELSELLEFPARFQFIHGSTRKFCRLAWKRKFRIGIQFDGSYQKTSIGRALSRNMNGSSWRSRL